MSKKASKSTPLKKKQAIDPREAAKAAKAKLSEAASSDDREEDDYKTVIQNIGKSGPSIDLDSLMKAPTGIHQRLGEETVADDNQGQFMAEMRAELEAAKAADARGADDDDDDDDELEYKTIMLDTGPKASMEGKPARQVGGFFSALQAAQKASTKDSEPKAGEDEDYKTVALNLGAPKKEAASTNEDDDYKTVALNLDGAKKDAASDSEDEDYQTVALNLDGDKTKKPVLAAQKTAPPKKAEKKTALTKKGDNKTSKDVTKPETTGGSWPVVTSPAAGEGGDNTYVGMPEAGMYINQYEIIRKLGEGGMGAVYLARDTRLGRRVAIKFLSSTDPELTKRFVIEARATARVEHENIVSIYEVGEWGAHPFMVLQFLQGKELSDVIPRNKAMPVPRVIEIMVPVLKALAYAHKEGIVHRDLKPDNIFLTDNGVIKVLDFGIAKVVQSDEASAEVGKKLQKDAVSKVGAAQEGMTQHGAIMGTMPFMSPEQWGNGVAIDHTSDIWAVGILMFIMLSGRHPLYPLRGHELMITGLVDEPMPKLHEKNPNLPKKICDIVDKCLLKDKSKRWADAESLLEVLEEFLASRTGVRRLSSEESPYAGLEAFQEEDAHRFFGRSREVSAMVQRLRTRPLIGVIGPSGIGKSSFLRAGVVPALRNSGDDWDIKVVRPGNDPLGQLASLLVQTGDTTSSDLASDLENQRQTVERLRKEPGYLGMTLRRTARREKKNYLLFIDQFEETYTLVHDQAERLAYTAAIMGAADDPASPIRVVLSMRSDFLDRCTEDVHFMDELSQGLLFLTPMTREGMREALILPAQMAGYDFEDEAVVDEMLDHLASTSGALPLLQFTADMLWGERDTNNHLLTRRSYDNLGGITGALATHADRVLEQTAPNQRNLVRGLFLRLVTPERTRAIVAMSDLNEEFGKDGDMEGLIDRLVSARLLTTSSSGGGAATVEIVHESLIHGWPQLARWLDEGQEDAAFLEQLRNTARQWIGKGKDSGLLWRGEMAEEAVRFVKRFRGQLPDVQKAFLKAVIDAKNRSARLKRFALMLAAAAAVVLLAAAAVALYVINESRTEAQAQSIVAQEQSVKALEQEKIAKEAAAEAEVQRQAAEKQKQEAENNQRKAEEALAEVKAAQKAEADAREAEAQALNVANRSKEDLARALQEAQISERRAVQNAAAAAAERARAEAKAREALAARNEANRSAKEARTAKERAEVLQAQAEARAKEAQRRLNEMTRGGVIEELR